MVDPTEHANKLVNEEEKRIHRLAREADAQLPRYSRQATKLTREQQKQDYLMAKNTPGGFRVRLREWKEQFGLYQAVNNLLDWSEENE